MYSAFPTGTGSGAGSKYCKGQSKTGKVQPKLGVGNRGPKTG